MCPPAEMSTLPTMSLSSRPARTSTRSAAATSMAALLAEIFSVATALREEPLLTAMAALARLRPPPTVASKSCSTSSSAWPVATWMESATASDRFASISALSVEVETLRVLPDSSSISEAAKEAESAAVASRLPPELTATEEPAATSKFLPTVWIMSSAASTKRVVVSRAISCTAEMSSVRLSMTYRSVEETSIADMTTARLTSALRSREPPECMPRLLAATVSTKEAVRLSCSPTLVAAWRPVRTTESRISICISSPAEARMPPTDESSMFGVETLTRSDEMTCTMGEVRIVSSSAESSSVLPRLPVMLVSEAWSASSTETSAEPPTPTSRSPIEASTLSKALTWIRSEVTLATSPAASVTVSWTWLITSAETVRSVETRSHSAVSAPTRKEPEAEVTASPSVSMSTPAGEARVRGIALSLAVIVDPSIVSVSTCTLPVPGVSEMSASELISEPSTTRSTSAARSLTARVSEERAPPITAPCSRVMVSSATSASASICE